MGFRFGKADKYWEFVDEGVQGVGGFKGSGNARGGGSRFKFRYANPGGALVSALKRGYGLSTSHAFGAGYNIKRRGLERTQFYSKPIKEQLAKLPKDLLKGFAQDIDTLIGKMPRKMIVVKEEILF